MAKVGYIFIATNGEEYAEDKAWMQQYGCVQVIEELSELALMDIFPTIRISCSILPEAVFQAVMTMRSM